MARKLSTFHVVSAWACENQLVFALKRNQGALFDDVVPYFESVCKTLNGNEPGYDYYETLEKDHGRIEQRRYSTMDCSDWIKNSHSEWARLNTIGVVLSKRTVNGISTTEARYYISSLKSIANPCARAIRSHWVLDVTFNEDSSRVRKAHAPENLAILRHLALNLIKQESSGKKKSIRVKRKLCDWDNNYLAKVLWPL